VDKVQAVQVLMPGKASVGALGIDGAGLVVLAVGEAPLAKGLVGHALDHGEVGIGGGDDGAQVVFVPVALLGIGGAGAGAAVDGLALKVQGTGVVGVQDGQGFLAGGAGLGLAGDFADALVFGAIQEADSGGVAVGGFDGQALGVIEAAPGVGAGCAVAAGYAGDVAVGVVAVGRVGQFACGINSIANWAFSYGANG
jgi:hypothetical protein